MKHPLRLYTISHILFLFFLFTGCKSEPKFHWRVQLEPGDSLRYFIDVSQRLRTMSLNMRQNVKFFQCVTVREKIGDSVFRLSNRIERIIVEQFLPGPDSLHRIYFDSDKRDTAEFRFNILVKTFSQMVNKDFDMWLHHKGHVVRSEFEQIINNIMPAKEGFAQLTESRLARDASFEQFAAVLPQQAAGEGHQYSHEEYSRVGTYYPLKIRTRYRVADVKNDKVTLAYETTFSVPDSNRVPFVFQGKQKGQYLLDRRDFLALENNYHQNVEMNLALFGFPVTVFTDTDVRVKRLP